jgi:hypothetical protein
MACVGEAGRSLEPNFRDDKPKQSQFIGRIGMRTSTLKCGGWIAAGPSEIGFGRDIRDLRAGACRNRLPGGRGSVNALIWGRLSGVAHDQTHC